MKRTILVLDDNLAVRHTCVALLEDDDVEVIEAGSLAEARELLASHRFDAAILDLHLPDGLGTDLTPELRARYPQAAIIVMSGDDAVPYPDVDLVLVKGDPRGLSANVFGAIERRTSAR